MRKIKRDKISFVTPAPGIIYRLEPIDRLKFSLFFKVITQEDWNDVRIKAIENTSIWASLYFVALITFANYILTNLLISIIVDGFVKVSKIFLFYASF